MKQQSDIMRNFTRQSFCVLSAVHLKLLSCDLFRGWLFPQLKRLKWLKVTHELLPTGIQLTQVQDFKITCSLSCSEVTFVFIAPWWYWQMPVQAFMTENVMLCSLLNSLQSFLQILINLHVCIKHKSACVCVKVLKK